MRVLRKLISVGVMSSALLTFAQTQSTMPPAVDAVSLPYDRGAGAVWQSLLKLQSRASLIMITAHPDDEDGGMLTYQSRGRGSRVSLLTLNRGEGGQNVMSDDYWDGLGQVRTQELLQADRYYGVEQYWTRVADYGFSKTQEEALQKWGHDRVLYDVVRVIRMTRPLVVTSVFVGGPTDGHGNHQVAGLMAQEVFDAAADPNVFPDQVKAGLLPWKPLKVYARVPFFAPTPQGMYDYATGKYVPVRFYNYVTKKWAEGPLSTDAEIPSVNYDPVLGENYVQVARTGLGWQKSQTGGTGPVPAGGAAGPSSAAPVFTGYHRFASAVPVAEKEKSFFDGIDVSLLGIADLAKGGDSAFLKQGLTAMNNAVTEAVSKFAPNSPEKVVPALARGLKATRALVAEVEKSNLSPESKYNIIHELRVKEQQFNDAIVQSLGISLLATVAPEKDPTGRFAMFAGMPETFSVAIPGQEFWVKLQATNQSSLPVQVTKFSLKNSDGKAWQFQGQGKAPESLANNISAAQRFKVAVPKDAVFTRPYYSRPNYEQAWYEVAEPQFLNMSTAPYPLAAEIEFSVDGEFVRMSQTVQTVRRVNGPGVVFEPLIVGPAVSVAISPRAGVVPVTGTAMNVTVALRSNVKGEAKGTIRLDLPQGWTSEPLQRDYAFQKDGEAQHVSFTVKPGKIEQKAYRITAVAEFNGEKFSEGYEMVGYEGLRKYPLYSAATYATSGTDVKVAPELRVGYVTGTGDEVSKSLADIGVNVQFLSAQDIATGDLGKLDCIVLGVRAYAARPELITYNGRLLQYVNNGGVVFVQYNTGQYDHNFGPYPYSLTNDPEKVVDETAKVAILNPEHPLMSWPNKITSADFEGWVEERGHSFMKSWDSHYEPLTEVHDPEQDPQKGGLLYAKYGKGAYIYAAYALYRQLPEGVPGAFRLVANILSLSHSPAMSTAASNSGGGGGK